jgi:hypothetical protein
MVVMITKLAFYSDSVCCFMLCMFLQGAGALAPGLTESGMAPMVAMDAVIAAMLDTLDDVTAVERLCLAKGRPSSHGGLSILPCR